jgi:membrane-associated PAP2 superfamily phosphatase
MNPAPGRRGVIALAAALALLLAWDASGADLAAMRWVAGPAGFAWRDAWLTRTLLHDGGRALAMVVLAAVLAGTWRPVVRGPSRAERLRAVAVVLAGLLLVPLVKRVSRSSCPWDLAEFGGVARYVSHWRLGVADGGPGHCFPSGHAVAAFAFLPLVLLWQAHRPAVARTWLAGVLLAGLAFGAAQWLRGAHYPSHTLWTAWICWLLAVLSAPAVRATPAADRASAPRPARAAARAGRHADGRRSAGRSAHRPRCGRRPR